METMVVSRTVNLLEKERRETTGILPGLRGPVPLLGERGGLLGWAADWDCRPTYRAVRKEMVSWVPKERELRRPVLESIELTKVQIALETYRSFSRI